MIYSGIDIGSDTIKIVVGEVNDNGINILASCNTRSVGIKKGIICDKSQAEASINLALDEIEKQLGFRIDKAIITVPFYDVLVNAYNGESYPEGVITGEDIITCLKSSVSTIDPFYEVVTVSPIDFLIDGSKKVLNPIGYEGNKLECRMLISTIPKENILPYLELLEKCHVEVIDLSFGPINDFENIKEHESYNNCSLALVDIGKDKTEVAIFNKGLMIKGEVLPLGSRLVDQDIRYIYKLDKTTARYIKENLSFATSQYADDKETFEYTTMDGEKIVINQTEISQVVEARLEEILKNVKKSLNSLTNREISYIIVTGGISSLPGFDFLINSVYGDIASSISLNTMGVRNNIYTSCVGMLKYYYNKLKIRGIDYSMYDHIEDMIVSKKNVLHEKVIDDLKKYFEDN